MDDLINILNSIVNFLWLISCLSNYLNINEDTIEYLQNINLLNDFVLFIIQNYSYQIDRETAQNIKMSSEVIIIFFYFKNNNLILY